jgi:hypothetical protein
MSGEVGRLERLYAEMGDAELLRLGSDPESLTEAAQVALTAELKRRGLEIPADGASGDEGEDRGYAFGVGIPGIMPGAAEAVEEALEPSGEQHAGMESLLTLYDGMVLSRVCSALEDGEIEPAVEAHEGDASQGQTTWFRVWVEVGEIERAKQVLQENLGLFPPAEADEIDDEENMAEVTEGEVGDFDSVEEAEGVRALLTEAGFAASVEKRDEADDEGKIWSTVKVDPERREEAMEFLAERLGLE